MKIHTYTFAKEVIINFHVRTVGIFDVIEPVLEDGEVFDSSLLKETVNSFIATGKRNVVIDLAQLDYIYSDTINVLMALNKRISDVNGIIALLNPRPEVVQILQRAGIFNSLRIYNSDEQLLVASEEIMSQSSANGESQSLSEFDQLRSEIGSVFGDHDNHTTMNQGNIYSQPAENDYTSPLPGNASRPAAPRPMPPQGPYTRPGSNQQPSFQPRQFNPPPPPPPPPVTPSRSPAFPQSQGYESTPPAQTRSYIPEPDKNEPEYSPETQFFQPAPLAQPKQTKKHESPITFSFNDDVEETGKPKKKFSSDALDVEGDDTLESDNDLIIDRKKKSPALILALVAIILLAVVGGVLFGYMNFSKKPQIASKPVETTTPPPSVSAVQPPPAQPVPAVTTPAQQTAITETEKKVSSPVTPVPKQTPRSKPVEKRIAQKPVQEKVVQPREEEPVVAKKPVVTDNKVIVTSNPTGASVTVNGDLIGKTPLTWDKPVFGPLSIELAKAGYKSTSKDIEFTGGIVKENFTLAKEAPMPPPKPEPKLEPEPVRVSTPPAKTEPEPVRITEPEEERSVEPVVKSPSAATGSGDAQIFIASIPPVADVYLNGKLVGRTNVSEIKLPSGTMTLRFVKGPKEVSQEITLQPGKNPSRLVRLP